MTTLERVVEALRDIEQGIIDNHGNQDMPALLKAVQNARRVAVSSSGAGAEGERERSQVMFDFQHLFRRLETESPERRAHLFYELEHRWCWDCGHDNPFCKCTSVPAPAGRERRFGLAPVNAFEYHAGRIIREAVEHDADKMRFYLTVSVGELAQRIARVVPTGDPEVERFKNKLETKRMVWEAAFVSLVARLREFVDEHCRNGSKAGRADYTRTISLDRLESLRIAFDEFARHDPRGHSQVSPEKQEGE